MDMTLLVILLIFLTLPSIKSDCVLRKILPTSCCPRFNSPSLKCNRLSELKFWLQNDENIGKISPHSSVCELTILNAFDQTNESIIVGQFMNHTLLKDVAVLNLYNSSLQDFQSILNQKRLCGLSINCDFPENVSFIANTEFKLLLSLSLERCNLNGLTENWLQLMKANNLRTLKLTDSNLTSLNKVDKNLLSNLQTLDLSRNNLMSLNLSMSNFTEIKYLILRENSISFIKDGFFNFAKSLNTLDLSHNDLSQLSCNTFTGLRKLKRFKLNSNYLTSQKDILCAFEEFQHLELLDISFNIFTKIPSLKAFVIYLEHLNLKNNSISSEMDYLMPLVNIKYLDVSYNQISSISLPKLRNDFEFLDISHNLIKRLPQQTEILVRKGGRARFQKNPLECDCHVLWLRKFSLGFQVLPKYMLDVTCSKPIVEYLLQIDDSYFNCLPPHSIDIKVLNRNGKRYVSCTAEGIPKPDVLWISVKIDTNNSNSNILNKSTVDMEIITELAEYKSYLCQAKNVLGTAESKSMIIIESPQTSPNKKETKERTFSVNILIISVFGTFVGTLLLVGLLILAKRAKGKDKILQEDFGTVARGSGCLHPHVHILYKKDDPHSIESATNANKNISTSALF
ncbi:unnamed protein product [Dimorphilus gyrociliatus]|uniref:Ig-like domain-containing protein n=1 Tax=Dimorphilus gyrociliatus TaxID=2664684 RepID=A0A7I8VDA2_9ANNE|nr:unnamed protein product [Dimorphilus gyrociliatus]